MGKTLQRMDESRVLDVVEQKAERYLRKYRSLMEDYSSAALVGKFRSLGAMDFYQLGESLERWNDYQKMHEDNGSLSDLGRLPQIALEVITAQYGISIIPLLASMQPLADEVGIVWYKKLIAKDARGNFAVDETIIDPRTGMPKIPVGYSNERYGKTYITQTAGGDRDYSLTLVGADPVPIRPGTVTVAIPGLSLSATDSTATPGFGSGPGIQFTINYVTGAVELDLVDDPAGIYDITINYSQNFEASTDIPELSFEFDSTTVQAEIFAAKMVIGMLKEFALNKRWGKIGQEQVALDLTSEMTAETTGAVIRAMYVAATANGAITADRTFNAAVPTGISEAEHRQSFMYRVASAETQILAQAGRGQVNVMLAGRKAAEIIRTVPGFTVFSNTSNNIGPHAYGMLNGITVIRVPQTNIVPTDEIVCLWKGVSAFETPCVYAEWMPLFMTNAIPVGGNPLMTQKAVATSAAIKVLVAEFLTRMKVVIPV